MTTIKAQAAELLQDIPDNKLLPVIEILKGLRILYIQSEKPETSDETPASVMGICGKYANPDLVPLEKEAWGEAVKEKYAVN